MLGAITKGGGEEGDGGLARIFWAEMGRETSVFIVVRRGNGCARQYSGGGGAAAHKLAHSDNGLAWCAVHE